MKNMSYILLVSFTAKLTRKNLNSVASLTNAAIRKSLSDAEAIMTSDSSVVFLGNTCHDAATVFKAVASDLRAGDQLTMIQLGLDLLTTQPAVMAWHVHHQTNQGGASPA